MRRNNVLSYLALGIVFALFHVIAFVIPTEKTATFWTAYGFTVVAFAAQILLWKIAFSKDDCNNSSNPTSSFHSVTLTLGAPPTEE